jgi:2'-5' RNA ligase
MMRTFVGVKILLGTKMHSVLDEVRQELRYEKIKWVDLSTLHVTLFFLGDTTEPVAKVVCKFISDSFSQTNAFSLLISGLGAFGERGNPRVIWIGLEPNKHLNDIQHRVEQLAVALGFQPDARGFNPHITIARVKSKSNASRVYRVLSEYGPQIQQQVHIDEVILYKSELTPIGAMYTKYCSQNLANRIG